MRFLSMGAVLFWASFFCASGVLAAEEMRTWTSGKFKVEARFVKFADGKVELDTGSKTVQIVESKLSAADREYLAGLRRRQEEEARSLAEVDGDVQSKKAIAALRKYRAFTKKIAEARNKNLKRLARTYQQDQENLVAEYDQKRSRYCRDALIALEAAMKAETKSGNREEVIRIKKEIASLKQRATQSSASPSAGSSSQTPAQPTTAQLDWSAEREKLLGSWKWGARGMKDTAEFFEDGTATASWGGEGTWERQQQRILIKWLNNKTTFGSPKWDTMNMPIDVRTPGGDSWVGPGMLRAEKIGD